MATKTKKQAGTATEPSENIQQLWNRISDLESQNQELRTRLNCERQIQDHFIASCARYNDRIRELEEERYTLKGIKVKEYVYVN